MEQDRLETNLGPAQEVAQETPVVAKVPKKRFVGRRTAEKAEKDGAVAGSIEDSGAIQGM